MRPGRSVSDEGAPQGVLVHPPGPRWLRRVLAATGTLYLAATLLGGAGSSLGQTALPRLLLYFTQVACLFPHAAKHSIEYRAAAYSCHQRRFEELDHRAYFPLRPDDKENRYHRLAHFYRRNRRVMQALEWHVVERHNAAVARGESPRDGVEGPIGGIVVMSLRVPLPEPGAEIPRYARMPLQAVPRDWAKLWYYTPRSRRSERCGEGGT